MNRPESILAIHQEPEILKAWAEIAQHTWKAPVTCCNDFAAAEQTLRAEKFSLIVCGHQTEAESGLQFLKRLRAEGITTPALLVSTVLNSRTIFETFRLPDTEFLQTPFSLTDLQAAWQALSSS